MTWTGGHEQTRLRVAMTLSTRPTAGTDLSVARVPTEKSLGAGIGPRPGVVGDVVHGMRGLEQRRGLDIPAPLSISISRADRDFSPLGRGASQTVRRPLLRIRVGSIISVPAQENSWSAQMKTVIDRRYAIYRR